MFKINPISYHLIIWLALTSTAPFILYAWPGHPYKILTFVCLLVMIFFLLSKGRKSILIDRSIIKIIYIQIGYYVVKTCLFQNYSNLNLCIQFIALYIIITFIDNFIGFKSFVKSYIYVILIMGIGGVITFFVHLIIGIPPIFEVQYSPTGISYFLGLTCTNDYYNLEGLRLLRYAGFFDEPGAFALFSLFAIVLNKIYFNNNKIERYLIIITGFTFSMAFYLIITIYLFLFYAKLSHLKYLLLLSVCITASYYSLSNYNGDNKTLIMVNAMTFDRFKIDENGNISGNNRLESTLNDKRVFLENPIWGEQRENKVRGSNVYSILASHGLVGSFFYYAFLVYLLFLIMKLKGSKRTLYLKLFVIIVINFFHRPEFSAVFTLLVIYSIIKSLGNDSHNLVSKNNFLLENISSK